MLFLAACVRPRGANTQRNRRRQRRGASHASRLPWTGPKASTTHSCQQIFGCPKHPVDALTFHGRASGRSEEGMEQDALSTLSSPRCRFTNGGLRWWAVLVSPWFSPQRPRPRRRVVPPPERGWAGTTWRGSRCGALLFGGPTQGRCFFSLSSPSFFWLSPLCLWGGCCLLLVQGEETTSQHNTQHNRQQTIIIRRSDHTILWGYMYIVSPLLSPARREGSPPSLSPPP